MKFTWLLAALCSVALVAVIGHQCYEANRPLPSGFYDKENVQYHAPGPDFKLTREPVAELNCASDHEEGE